MKSVDYLWKGSVSGHTGGIPIPHKDLRELPQNAQDALNKLAGGKMIDLREVQNSGLHDYEIAEIQVNYSSAYISMSFKSPRGTDFKLSIENFTTIEITHKEEWGKGKYVCASNITYDDVSKSYLLKIQLNSGDEIVVGFIAECSTSTPSGQKS